MHHFITLYTWKNFILISKWLFSKETAQRAAWVWGGSLPQGCAQQFGEDKAERGLIPDFKAFPVYTGSRAHKEKTIIARQMWYMAPFPGNILIH